MVLVDYGSSPEAWGTPGHSYVAYFDVTLRLYFYDESQQDYYDISGYTSYGYTSFEGSCCWFSLSPVYYPSEEEEFAQGEDNVTIPSLSVSVTSPDNFTISTVPAMPVINGSATGPPPSRIHWSAQIVFTSPTGTCSGGPNFDSSIVDGYVSTFTPTFGGFYGGALLVSVAAPGPQYFGDSWAVGGTNPSATAIRTEIGNPGSPFDSGDLNRIACWESMGMNQFREDGYPYLGGGGDAGIFQICFQRTEADIWNWKTNIARGKGILQDSLTWADTVPARVRTYRTRNQGPFPDATDFTDDQRRLEAIHAYNAGTDYNQDGYWQWDNIQKTWYAAPQGGQAGYVDNVLAQNPICR